MKTALIALLLGASAVACGENKPAETPSTTSAGTPTTTTETTAQATSPAMASTPASPSTSTTDSANSPSSPSSPSMGSGSMAPAPNPAMNSGDHGAAPAAQNPGSADQTKDATNTKTNDRDRHGALTPMDQGGGKDRDITAAIRRSVVSDTSLGFNAKNVKIITVAGKVTLRGPVKSEAERATIEAKAKAANGVTEVDNQLEVKK